MKILLMGFSKIKYMPYANFYLDNIDCKEYKVHFLYWNRDLKEEDTSRLSDLTLHEFKCFQKDDVSKFSKITSFIKYRKYAKRLLQRESFDFIFVLHSLPGVLLADVLKKKYSNKFIFDYRDSTYEGFAPFKKIIGDLVKYSIATFVSSDAFRRFLPEDCKGKIHTSHNLLLDSLKHRDEKKINGITSDKIRIGFWGFIRHEEINKEIIKKIAADSRFELHYYGREQQIAINLKKYAKEIRAENVFFHGEYTPEERYDFVRQTDIIHNIYYDDNMMLAMGNKYYDGVIFRIPQVCIRGSHMGQRAVSCNVGVESDPYSALFTETMFSYYRQMDLKKFSAACDIELERILNEYEAGRRIIQRCIET